MSLPWGFHKPGEFEVVNYRLSTTLMQVLFGTFSFRGVTVRMTSHRPRIDRSLRGRNSYGVWQTPTHGHGRVAAQSMTAEMRLLVIDLISLLALDGVKGLPMQERRLCEPF